MLRRTRRIFCAAATSADYALPSPCVRRHGYGAPQRRVSVAGRPRQGRAALHELPAPVLTIQDVPHRMCVRHRAASLARPRSRPARPAVAGAAADRPGPVALPRRRHAHHGQPVAGHACPLAGTGLPSRLRRDPRPADGHLHYLLPGSRCAMRASRAICYGSRRDDMSRLSRSWNGSLVPRLTKYVSELQICLSRLSESNR
jgi:hypothetical protein